MSLTTLSRVSAEERITRMVSKASAGSDMSSSSLLNPITPFSGVRISWLMCARKRPLASLASSARFFSSNTLVRSVSNFGGALADGTLQFAVAALQQPMSP